MNGWKEQTALSLVSCLSPQSAARGVGEFENPRKNTAEIVDYMDWNSKTSCWDLTGFEQDVIPKMDAFDRPTIFQDYRTRSDFSVDLRLGEAGNSSDESLSKWQGASKIESSASGLAKKARGANKGTQAVSCLVDGCDADLSRCRDYHRRHKVCEIHSKSPQVTVGGQKQRFCQQCSRFHSPEEFDEGKRSCRKRLDGHNRRRRKPRPDPHSDPGSFFSHYQGTQSLPFSGAQAYPSPNVVNPTWLGVANTEAGGRHYNLHQRVELLDRPSLFLGPSLNSYKGGKQVTFLEGDSPMATTLTNQTTAEASVCQPLLATIASLENNGSNHNRFRNKLTTQVCDADCALSLLSSMQMQTPGNHMMQPNSILSASLNAQSLEPVDLVLVSDGNNADAAAAAAADGHSNCSGILPLQPGAESSCGNKASHSLPFHWN